MNNFSLTKLKNGLRVVTAPMEGTESVTAMVLIGAGSRYETKEINGISHFLEHMAFKGTNKRPTAQAISSLLDGIGADFNASTSKEETIFYAKAAKKHLSLITDFLSDIIFNLKLDPKEIEKEKGVIVEEINMYEDIPMRRVGEVFEALLFPNSPLGWDIAGDKQTVSGITKEDFLKYRARLYYPENMVFVVAGGVKEEDAVKLAEKFFGSAEAKGVKTQPQEAFQQFEPRLVLKNKKTDQTHIVLGVRGNPLGHKDRYVEAILAAILGGGMSSRLFVQVREKRGLAYYIRTEPDHYLDNGYLATSAGVDTKRTLEAIKVILEEYQSISQTAVSPKEINKAKEFIKGKFILDLEDSRNVAGLYGGQQLLEESLRSPKDILAEIDKVTVEDVLRVAKEFFTNNRLNLAIIGPFEDAKEFEKILKIA